VSDSPLSCLFAGRGCVRFCQCIQKGCPLFGVSKRGATDARSVDVRCGGVGPRGNQGENTMQRRKFLIGAGSAAVGSSALIGSGAFTSVNAARDISIQVAGDASAYLQITREDTPNGNEYVLNTENGLALNFDSVNTNADSKFANLFKVKNQGTQIVRVGVDKDASDLPSGFGIFAEGPQNNGDLFPKNNVQPHDSDIPEGRSSGVDVDGENGFDGDIDYKASSGSDDTTGAIATGAGFEYPSDPVHLETGEQVENIGVGWDRNDVDFAELEGDHTMVIKAVAFTDGQPGERD